MNVVKIVKNEKVKELRKELIDFMKFHDNKYAFDKRLDFHREKDADEYLKLLIMQNDSK